MTQTLQLFTFQQLLQNTGKNMFFSTSPSTFGQQNHIFYLKYRFLNTLNSGPRVPVSPVSDTFGFQRRVLRFLSSGWICVQDPTLAWFLLPNVPDGHPNSWKRLVSGRDARCKGSCLKRHMNIYIYKSCTTRYSIHERILNTIHFSILTDDFWASFLLRSLLGTQLMTVAWMGRPPGDEHQGIQFEHLKTLITCIEDFTWIRLIYFFFMEEGIHSLGVMIFHWITMKRKLQVAFSTSNYKNLLKQFEAQ